MLAAVADGLALRALADPAAPVIDQARRRCLLGTAALALIAGAWNAPATATAGHWKKRSAS